LEIPKESFTQERYQTTDDLKQLWDLFLIVSIHNVPKNVTQ